ncbi:hypothetical protein LCGC14_2814660, partial [marine sediment metagenome]
NDIMSVVGPKILDYFLAKSGDLDKNLEDAYSVIMHARRAFYNVKEARVHEPLSETRPDSIRTQFINYFKEAKNSGTIYFYGLVIDNTVFSLNFELSEFASKFTQLDGNNRPDWWSAFDMDYIENHNKQIIDARADILLDLITDLPLHYNTRVRIFITQNFGVSKTSGVDFGYQYISSTSQAGEWIPRANVPQAHKPAYIDIDLSSGNQAWELAKLRYVVLLSLSTERASQNGGGFYNVRDFNLIIKKEGSYFNDPNYLAIFNSQFLTQIFPIHSVAGTPSTTRRSYSQVSLVGPYGDFFLSDNLVRKWTESSNFIPLWVSSHIPMINNFDYYRDFTTRNP